MTTIYRSLLAAVMTAALTGACARGGKMSWGVRGLPPTPDSLPTYIRTNVYVAKTVVPFDQLRATCDHYVSTTSDTVVIIAHVGLATNIPEFHDCQRMINQNGDQFSSLIGIYATQEREPIPNPLMAYLVAVILNYDSLYAPLGIEHGANCLYLQMGITASAWVVPNGQNLTCQFSRLAATLGPTSLQVKRSALYNPQNYPRVARWDWDAPRNEQYMGIECGGWCEIGRPGFQSSPLPTLPGHMLGAGNERVYKIKAWFDAQRLAIRQPGTNKLVPGPAMGYLFPSVALDAVSSLSQFNSHFKVAVGFLSSNDPTYFKKYLLTDTVGTQISLADMTAAAGRGYFDRGPGIMPDRSVHRYEHPTGSPRVRGVARWHWNDDDEKTWVACVQGCCQVDPF